MKQYVDLNSNPCKRGERPYLCDFFWVDKNGRLLTPDKEPVTDKSSTHVQAGEDTSLLGLRIGVWAPRRHLPHWKTYCTLGNDSQRLNLWVCRAFVQPHRWRSPPSSPRPESLLFPVTNSWSYDPEEGSVHLLRIWGLDSRTT